VSIQFEIERDEEFYVYLKSHLPPAYSIEAQPSSSYYSEWLFRYDLYAGEKVIRTFEGDFRTLSKGDLIVEARNVLRDLNNIGQR
jgi:hypothetical protein